MVFIYVTISPFGGGGGWKCSCEDRLEEKGEMGGMLPGSGGAVDFFECLSRAHKNHPVSGLPIRKGEIDSMNNFNV